jgi:DNA-binding transcriptional LysR family regulator
MIDRYLLRYFLAVVDHGNFSRAAAACNVSQPTLSVGIAKLETTLGHALFLRTNRRVELTAAGARLAGHARTIEAGFAAAERDVAGAADSRSLRLGVLSTTPRRWIELFLRTVRGAGSGDRVELVEGKDSDLRERLARGRLDAALMILRQDDERHQPLLTEGYALAMPATHPLAGEATIRAEDLVNDPMIVRRHCELLSETSRFFTARGVRPFFPARTSSDDRAMGYVAAGLAVTVMPDCFRHPGMIRRPLDGFGFSRTIGLAYAGHVDAAALRDGPTIAALIAAVSSSDDT